MGQSETVQPNRYICSSVHIDALSNMKKTAFQIRKQSQIKRLRSVSNVIERPSVIHGVRKIDNGMIERKR